MKKTLLIGLKDVRLIFRDRAALITMLLTATGLDLLTALSAAAACVNNLGPGLGAVGPATTYATLTDFQTWICAGAMLLGRLELLTAPGRGCELILELPWRL